MDIAIIIHELLVEGGGERQCVSLAQALAQHGHKVTLYTSQYSQLECFPETCQSFTIKDVGRGALPWLRKPLFVRGYLDMRRLASAVEQRHQIWNPHHWPAQWAAVWLKRKLGGGVVWMCNDVPDFQLKCRQRESLRATILSPLYWLYYLYDRRQNRRIQLTLLLSWWAEREYKAIYPGATEVVRSGADPHRFFPGGDRLKIRTRFGFSHDVFVLLWLGIFMPHRRLEDVIEATSRLTSRGLTIRVLLAGSGYLYPRYVKSLKALATARGVRDQVIFAGKVSDREIRDFYVASDAFVFPNERQTWGLAVLEAMACGCPVLVSTGAAVQEILTDNVNAMLFPARNPEVLAHKIALLATHRELRSEIARQGIELFRSKYNWDRFADQIGAICDQLVLPGHAPDLSTSALSSSSLQS